MAVKCLRQSDICPTGNTKQNAEHSDSKLSNPRLAMNEKEMFHEFFKNNPCLLDVLQLTCDGHTRNEIANIRDTSPHTIKTEQEKIRKKFGVNNNTRAVVLGLFYELIVIRHIDEPLE